MLERVRECCHSNLEIKVPLTTILLLIKRRRRKRRRRKKRRG